MKPALSYYRNIIETMREVLAFLRKVRRMKRKNLKTGKKLLGIITIICLLSMCILPGIVYAANDPTTKVNLHLTLSGNVSVNSVVLILSEEVSMNRNNDQLWKKDITGNIKLNESLKGIKIVFITEDGQIEKTFSLDRISIEQNGNENSTANVWLTVYSDDINSPEAPGDGDNGTGGTEDPDDDGGEGNGSDEGNGGGNENGGDENDGDDNEGGDNEGDDNEGDDNEGGDNEDDDNEGDDNEGNDNEGDENDEPEEPSNTPIYLSTLTVYYVLAGSNPVQYLQDHIREY